MTKYLLTLKVDPSRWNEQCYEHIHFESDLNVQALLERFKKACSKSRKEIKINKSGE